VVALLKLSSALLDDLCPPNGGLFYMCSLFINHMYSVQYWNEAEATWKGTGSGTFYDRDMARVKVRALSEMCDYCVRFRIEELQAV